MRYALVVLMIAGLLAGCGTASSQRPGPSTADQTHLYKDPTYHFTFRYPTRWSVPNRGHPVNIGGVPTYVVKVNTPGSDIGLEVTVDQDVRPLPAFQEGEVASDPGGGPDTLHYHHAKVSGWKAMRIEQYSGKQMDGLYTIANTHNYSYQVRMRTATPPFSQATLAGYATVVHSLKVPFS